MAAERTDGHGDPVPRRLERDRGTALLPTLGRHQGEVDAPFSELALALPPGRHHSTLGDTENPQGAHHETVVVVVSAKVRPWTVRCSVGRRAEGTMVMLPCVPGSVKRVTTEVVVPALSVAGA